MLGNLLIYHSKFNSDKWFSYFIQAKRFWSDIKKGFRVLIFWFGEFQSSGIVIELVEFQQPYWIIFCIYIYCIIFIISDSMPDNLITGKHNEVCNVCKVFKLKSHLRWKLHWNVTNFQFQGFCFNNIYRYAFSVFSRCCWRSKQGFIILIPFLMYA